MMDKLAEFVAAVVLWAASLCSPDMALHERVEEQATDWAIEHTFSPIHVECVPHFRLPLECWVYVAGEQEARVLECTETRCVWVRQGDLFEGPVVD